VNGSHSTGHRSSIPNRLLSEARSSSVVCGVMRSTMQLGNETCSVIQSASAGSRNEAKAVNTRRLTSPLPWMLSQDSTVKAGMPRSRRLASASVTRPKTVCGMAPGRRSACTKGSETRNEPVTESRLYPPSVMVSDTILIPGEASFSIAASGSSGANRYSTKDPITRGSQVPSPCLMTRVYRPSWAAITSRMAALDGCRPMPQMPQSSAAPAFISVSMYIAWCERWKLPTLMWAMPVVTWRRSYRGTATAAPSCPRVAALRLVMTVLPASAVLLLLPGTWRGAPYRERSSLDPARPRA